MPFSRRFQPAKAAQQQVHLSFPIFVSSLSW
jgi:hypothetical protein